MRRYLVLADAPLRGELVTSRLGEIDTATDRFHVVVPARDLMSEEAELVGHERGEADAFESPEVVAARWRLRTAMEALETVGLRNVTGDIGDPDPVHAVDEALVADEYDAVIVVTKPIGVKGWVHLDLPSRVARHIDEPVVHIEVAPLRL